MFGRFGRFHYELQYLPNVPNLPNPHRRGFTILELLVASLLLSMLVTVLTMIFNQSSVAWNTGVASVSDLESVRTKLGAYHDVFDDALPGVGQTGVRGIDDTGREIRYRTVSLFRNWGGGTLNSGDPSKNCSGRAFDRIDWTTPSLVSYESGMQDVQKGKTSGSLGSGNRWNSGNGGYIVGVRSAGPDRQFGTDDDINTFPEDVN